MSSKFTLSKKERLVQQGQFENVFKRGNRLLYQGQLAIFVKNRVGINRIGFVVPKGKVRLSSSRNRTKRLLREAYRLNKDKIESFSIDIIIIINNPLEVFPQAQRLILGFFDKINQRF
jgi:ribonuclease P protein component